MTQRRPAVVTGFILVLSVLACALPAWARGDDARSMTILPTLAQRVEKAQPDASFPGQALAIAADVDHDETKLVYLRFSLATVPQGATITGVTLKLSVLAAVTGQTFQYVRVLPVTFAAKLGVSPQPPLTWTTRPLPAGPAVGSGDARREWMSIDLDRPGENGWMTLEQGEVALMLRSPLASTEFAYRGLCRPGAAASPSCVNTQPRLIVRYEPLAAAATPWPQARYDAQHSARTPWQLSENDLVTGVRHRLLYTAPGYIGFSPVLAQRHLILYTERNDRGSDKFFVTAVDESGRERWDVHIGARVKFAPVHDGRGRVWVVTENALHRIEVGAGKPTRVAHELSALLGLGRVSVQAAPTLGANGALYLSTNRGVFAVTPYPDLRVWWRHVARPKFGQVALSADEGTAYVVNGTRESALVALDNTVGTARWRAGTIDTRDASTLPVPAVATLRRVGEPKPRTHVYLVSGYQRGRSLHLFDDGDTVRTISHPAEYLSRPLVSRAGRAVAVVKYPGQPGRICRYFWDVWDARMGLGWWCQPPGSENLSTLSVLAMDGHDNVYVIDGVTTPPKQKVRGYTSGYAPLFALEVALTARPSTSFGDNLLVGPGGTLFLANANALFAIEPATLRDTAPAALTLDASAVTRVNATAFLAPKITVAGDVAIGATQSLVLRAGAIGFQPGFKVLRGAELQCKPWRPSP